jgi:hypothetical protein
VWLVYNIEPRLYFTTCGRKGNATVNEKSKIKMQSDKSKVKSGGTLSDLLVSKELKYFYIFICHFDF